MCVQVMRLNAANNDSKQFIRWPFAQNYTYSTQTHTHTQIHKHTRRGHKNEWKISLNLPENIEARTCIPVETMNRLHPGSAK